VWTYHWNAAGMLVKAVRPDGGEVSFGYDPFGRRLWKRYRDRVTRWIWDGNVPLHESVENDGASATSGGRAPVSIDESAEKRRDAMLVDHPAQGPPLVTWLFHPESFAPVAKLVGEERLSIIADHLGAPIAMYDAGGAAVWSARIGLYGELHDVVGTRSACPFRWPGQYEDEETGLYYNRFRYYDPDAGQYIARDPLGLAAGIEPYLYVRDPLTWADPLGLAACRTANYTQQSRSHVFTHGHAANAPHIPGKSRFRPTEGGQKFTDEVLNHPNVTVTHQGNGRVRYDVPDMGRVTGTDLHGNPTRGGRVIVEGANPQPWSTYAPDEVVTQHPL
jgi:RHS repeat-associated protein